MATQALCLDVDIKAVTCPGLSFWLQGIATGISENPLIFIQQIHLETECIYSYMCYTFPGLILKYLNLSEIYPHHRLSVYFL